MKSNQTNQTTKTPAQHDNTGKHNRPENKDHMDSRKNEEYNIKGNDVTHNKKETKAGKHHK